MTPSTLVRSRRAGSAASPSAPASGRPAAGQGGKVLGYLLLGLGVFITMQMIWPGVAALLFPAALIAAGFWLLRRP